MPHVGHELALTVMDAVNAEHSKRGDGAYFHRVSGVSRCMRDMAMHGNGHSWSNPPQARWGTPMVFDQGHDGEDRVIGYFKTAGCEVICSQMRVMATTPMGIEIPGHIDGFVLVPDTLPGGGKWYLFDVKTAGVYIYGKIYDTHRSKPSDTHEKQLSVYALSRVDDPDYPEVQGHVLKDLHFDGYEFGGCMVAYLAKDKTGYKRKGQAEAPKFTICQFDPDEVEVQVHLDLFDEVQKHIDAGTLPPIPASDDEMIWGGKRCDPRWCQRYSICQELK